MATATLLNAFLDKQQHRSEDVLWPHGLMEACGARSAHRCWILAVKRSRARRMWKLSSVERGKEKSRSACLHGLKAAAGVGGIVARCDRRPLLPVKWWAAGGDRVAWAWRAQVRCVSHWQPGPSGFQISTNFQIWFKRSNFKNRKRDLPSFQNSDKY
jgi:hypothetical protein